MTSAAQARKSPEARKKRREEARRYTARRFELATALYAKLIAKLGGVCVICGEDGKTAPLSVDHVNGHGWPKQHNKYRFDTRVHRYYTEYEAGIKLRCLCVPCNSGNRPAQALNYPEAPF